VIITHVGPCLLSSSPVLKQRALNFVGRYANIQFTSTTFIPECTKAVCQAIVDKHLPVRVQAAVTVNCLLNYKQTLDMLRPELPTILEKYIEIM
jgi:hypothetical protein